ncbi:MAG: DHHW family protein [Angelakisella sp.]
MQKAINFTKKYPLLVGFCAFMLVVFVADMFATGKQFSELENRSLKQRPHFSWRSLAANEYTRKYEEFINDQFVERDRWISLKSATESLLLKVENNGVAFGAHDYLFGVKTSADEAQLDKNLGYLNRFLGSYSGHVTVGIIPNSYELMQSYLPTGLAHIQLKQQPYIEKIYSALQGSDLTTLDVSGALAADLQNRGEDTYYRTDHHWTTEGAYAAYAAYCQSRGLTAVQLSDIEHLRREEKGFYGTYYSKAKKVGTPAETLVWYDVPVTEMTVNGKNYVENADNTKTPITGLYHQEKFATRDKYAAFLYGNNGLTVIKSENNLNKQEGKTSRLLLIKDSYSNCLTPFLTYSYDELYVVDLRGLTQKLSQLIATTEFDDIFLLYNYESFESDRNITRLVF